MTRDLSDWPGCPPPEPITLEGARVRLEPLSFSHMEDLFALLSLPDEESVWEYMPYGPFPDLEDFREQMRVWLGKDDRVVFVIINKATGKPEGSMSLMRIDPGHGSIEIGAIFFTKPLRRTAAATEALFLLMDYPLSQLGYRRLEWKCDSLNKGSFKAAERLGFTYEGTFRQAQVVKNRNRDTMWLSILDHEWPALRAGYLKWLHPSNFDEEGRQKAALQSFLK